MPNKKSKAKKWTTIAVSKKAQSEIRKIKAIEELRDNDETVRFLVAIYKLADDDLKNRAKEKLKVGGE